MIKENRLAVLAIMVKDLNNAEAINKILHEHSQYIVGRMGIPYRERGVSLMSIFVDAPQDIISGLSGKLGKVADTSVKTLYEKE